MIWPGCRRCGASAINTAGNRGFGAGRRDRRAEKLWQKIRRPCGATAMANKIVENNRIALGSLAAKMAEIGFSGVHRGGAEKMAVSRFLSVHMRGSEPNKT
jgi:hypothetical protein